MRETIDSVGEDEDRSTRRALMGAILGALAAAAILIGAIAHFESTPSSEPQTSPFMRAQR
jgi:hypothetical protein